VTRLERTGVGEVSFFLNYGYISASKTSDEPAEVLMAPSAAQSGSSCELIGANNLR
jgi:hypothetical protein